METKVVKWKKGDKAGEMERWRKASGEEEGREGGKEKCVSKRGAKGKQSKSEERQE